MKKDGPWDHNDCIIPMIFYSSGNFAPKSKTYANSLWIIYRWKEVTRTKKLEFRYSKKIFYEKNLHSISFLFTKYGVKDIQNMEKFPIQRRLDQGAARDHPIEQEEGKD